MVDTNPNPNLPLKQHSFKNKNIDPGPPARPRVLLAPGALFLVFVFFLEQHLPSFEKPVTSIYIYIKRIKTFCHSLV